MTSADCGPQQVGAIAYVTTDTDTDTDTGTAAVCSALSAASNDRLPHRTNPVDEDENENSRSALHAPLEKSV
ncbi:hypothetical protein V9T40_007465 [Parthenolecanium corni]|uniref:Uncharacterized protein n=1 Tax=Parthenolecanium corni TaxID=536013 RepID=A0AAN9TJX5_9HEMI